MHKLLRRPMEEGSIQSRLLELSVQQLLKVIDSACRFFDARLRRSLTSRARGLLAAGNDGKEADDLLDRAIELAANGILVVDLEGQVLHFNSRFREMWGLTDRLLTDPSAQSERHQRVASQLTHPEQFLHNMGKVRQSNQETFDILTLLDGRAVERSSKPLLGPKGICGRVWSYYDVTERHRLEGQLRRLAERDPLTSLANRAHFMDRLAAMFANPHPPAGPHFVFYLDIDNFKVINDTLGHAAGDEALIIVADRIVEALDASDLVARLGGDEFGVLIQEGCSLSQASAKAEAICRKVRQPLTLEGTQWVLSICVGIASSAGRYRPDDVMRDADVALYAAKANGSGIEVYSEGMDLQAEPRPAPGAPTLRAS